MVRKLAIFTLLLSIVAIPALAQEYRGNLYLSVQTDDGTPIVGAAITVSGVGASRTSETNDQGEARFIKLEPGAYTVEVSKDGFNTLINQNVAVSTSKSTDLTVVLQRTEMVEEVTVTAVTPLMDKRKTGTSTLVSPEEINKIPTARDPWAVLSTIPGIQTDRINVGGNQSGQQSGFVGKGDDGDNATWVMDGVEFTDLAAQGGSSTYFDFNSFQEIGFDTGGGDLEQLTPGQRLNFTTKQGTNSHSGSLGLVFADAAFQDSTANYVDPDGEPVQGNQINEVFEKNFEIGGPIKPDTAWYWFGFSQNDVDNRLPGATVDDPLLTDRTKLQNVTGKINATFETNTSVKGFYTRGDKVKIGRNAGPDRPQPTSWDQSGPTPIYTFDISHFFTQDFELSGQYSHVGGGFQLIPQGTADQIRWDNSFVWQDTYVSYVTDRPTDQYAVRGNWFVETGAVNNEFKFGFKFKEGEVQSFSGYGTQGVVAAEWAGEAWLYRGGTAKEDMEYTSIWVGDTILLNNWTFNVGALYQEQSGNQLASTSTANGLCPDCIGDLSFSGADPGFEWKDVMPRVGITYAFDTAKRQLIRFNYGTYVDQLAAGDVAFNHPANSAEIDYAWNDLDSDGIVFYDPNDPQNLLGFNEIDPFPTGVPSADCLTQPTFVSNVDPCATTTPFVPDRIDPDLDAPQVDEAILGYEIELAKDFTLGVNLTNRVRDRELWAPLYDISDPGGPGTTTLLTLSNWEQGTQFDSTIDCFDDSGPCGLATAGTDYSVLPWRITDATISGGQTTNLRERVLMNRDGYEEEFQGVELVANKRLSNNWMFRGYFSWQDWTKNIDCTQSLNGVCIEGPGIQQPANLVGDSNVDGADVLVGGGTSSGGFSNVYLGSASWAYNLNGLYQLPKNFSIAANVNGREGYALPLFVTLDEFEVDGVRNRQGMQALSGTSERLDDLHIFDLRFGYLMQLEGGTALDLSFEVFNLFDDDTILQYQRRLQGAQSSNAGTIFETLSPRIFRLGARITFK